MNARAYSWWRLRTTREQRLLLAMFTLFAVTVVWFGIVRPLDDALAAARERHGRAVIAEAEARGQAAAIAELGRNRPRRLALPVRLFVPQSATAAGFTVQRADAFEPDGVNVMIGAARPSAFFAWVADLQSRGLIVEALSANPNPDQTLSVQVTVRQGGS